MVQNQVLNNHLTIYLYSFPKTPASVLASSQCLSLRSLSALFRTPLTCFCFFPELCIFPWVFLFAYLLWHNASLSRIHSFVSSSIILLNKKHLTTDSFKEVWGGGEDTSLLIIYRIFSSHTWDFQDLNGYTSPLLTLFLVHFVSFTLASVLPLGRAKHTFVWFSLSEMFSLKCFPCGLPSHLLPLSSRVIFPVRPQISISDISSHLSS